MKNYLVAICLRGTGQVVEWLDVPATDWISAVHIAFDIRRPQYTSHTHYGEAILV
jgi:hypothetical protein